MLSMGPESSTQGPICVHFQIGLLKEDVRIPEGHLSFQQAKHLAAEIIERKVLQNFNKLVTF